MGQEFFRVYETQDSCEVFQDKGSVVSVITPKITYFQKKVEVQAVTIVMMIVIIVMKILGDFLTSKILYTVQPFY
jgi:hypothetical protein